MTKKTKGQSLIEVMVAIAVLVLILLGMLTAVTYSVRNATFAKNQAIATKYTQEAMENARELRDTHRLEFFQSGSSSLTDCNIEDEAIESGFVLNRTCELVGEETVLIEVAVTWTDARGTHDATASSYLTKW